MHSLKNTVVAVGLLGLSFLFYQASSSNPSEQPDLMPALEVREGMDEIQNHAVSRLDAMQSKLESTPGFSAPDLSKPNHIASDMENITGESVALLKSQANNFAVGAIPPSRQALKSTPPPLIKSPTTTPITPENKLKQLENVSRDEGLIEALESQKQKSPSPTPTDQQLEPEPENEAADEFQFTSQPIPSSDSSYNRSATELSTGQKSNVIRADAEPDPANLNFQSVWSHVDRMVAEEEFRDALELLSRFYHSPDLTGPQRQRLIGWLDALAGKVIFSAEHHLQDMPYTVMNESLDDIGDRWKVPAELIYNINRDQFSDIAVVDPGATLKVVPGPFNAEIDLDQKIMTLFLGDLYAGRYPIRVGISGSPQPGTFRVLLKSAVGHSWRDADGKDYPPDSPENGYGPNWIGLSGSLCIHAVDDSVRDGHRGCIGLSPKDAKDVFAILADSSIVVIIR